MNRRIEKLPERPKTSKDSATNDSNPTEQNEADWKETFPSSDLTPPLFSTEPFDYEPATDYVTARVKWFNRAKGYGFITRGDDTKDIFFSAHEFEQKIDVSELVPGRMVKVSYRNDPKGLVAVDIVVIDPEYAGPPTSRTEMKRRAENKEAQQFKLAHSLIDQIESSLDASKNSIRQVLGDDIDDREKH